MEKKHFLMHQHLSVYSLIFSCKENDIVKGSSLKRLRSLLNDKKSNTSFHVYRYTRSSEVTI